MRNLDLGFVPKDVYICRTYDEAHETRELACANWAGIRDRGRVRQGWVILRHLERGFYAVVDVDTAQLGVFPVDYSREG